MLGSNVPARGGLPVAFEYARSWGCECIQVFITPSRKWDVPNFLREDVADFSGAWTKSKVKQVVAHVPYLVNLASINQSLWKKSKARLITELLIANMLSIPFLVLHPGSYGNSRREVGTKRLLDALNDVFDEVRNSSTMVLLETMAGQGTSLGWRFEEIAHFVRGNKHLGVCFDTAHVFEAGYDIRGYEGYERVLRDVNKLIGIEKIRVIHLNDSKTGLRSRIDRHASIGEGLLGLQVFHAIIGDSRFSEVPKILEVPDRDQKSKYDLDLLRRLREEKKPLEGEFPMGKTMGEGCNAFRDRSEI